MLLAPTASAAVVKPAVPLLSAAVSSTLPLLTSVKVTEPDAVPLLALTCAVKVTQESWATDVAEAVSVVLVATAACGTAAAPAVPRRTAAAVLAIRRPAATTRAQRIPAALPRRWSPPCSSRQTLSAPVPRERRVDHHRSPSRSGRPRPPPYQR